jgi:two-component system, NarL family, sensor kinase
MHRPSGAPYSDEDVTGLQPYADLLGLRLQVRDLADAVDAHRGDRDRLMAQAVSAQEAERRRIAFDLHDGVSTALAAMSFHLNAAELSMPTPSDASSAEAMAERCARAREQIVSARTLGDLAYQQTRAAITGLHSLVLDDLGLVAAMESLAKAADGVVSVSCDEASAFDDIPAHQAAALFRIAQEAISNAVRHSKARLIELTLRRHEDHVVLRAHDDGVGFDVRASASRRAGGETDAEGGHYGLTSIAERCALIGAELRIDSQPGLGTAVTVELRVGAEPA